MTLSKVPAVMYTASKNHHPAKQSEISDNCGEAVSRMISSFSHNMHIDRVNVAIKGSVV